MKKLIQITLIVVFVFVLFQAAAGGAMVSTGELGSRTANDTFFTANRSVGDVYAASCLVYRKGPDCAHHMVGWNG